METSGAANEGSRQFLQKKFPHDFVRFQTLSTEFAVIRDVGGDDFDGDPRRLRRSFVKFSTEEVPDYSDRGVTRRFRRSLLTFPMKEVD